MARTKYDRWTCVNRSKQGLLGGALVKDLKKLRAGRIIAEIRAKYGLERGVNVEFSAKDPGPGSAKVRINALKEMKVYGKGVNSNKLVTRHLFYIRNCLNTFNTTKRWQRKLKKGSQGETSEVRSVKLDPFPTRMEEPFEHVIIEQNYAKW